MNTTADSISSGRGSTAPWKDILAASVWLGCFVGLTEGLGQWMLQRLALVNWNMLQKGVTLQIVWIAMLVDVVLFAAVGAGFAMLAGLFRRLPVMKASVFVLFFLIFVNWLSMPGRIKWYGIAFMGIGLATVCTRWFEKNEQSILRFWRRTLPWALAAGLVAFIGIEGGIRIRERVALAGLPEAPTGSPNVILIVLDAVRADHLSAYGYSRDTSPNLARLAREGVLFENAFSASCWSPPSHASIVTGLYLFEHGMEWDHPRLDDKFLTIAEYLRDRGYRTAASSANTGWFTASLGFGRGFVRFDDIIYSPGDAIARTMFGRRLPVFITSRLHGRHKLGSVVSQDAMRWMRRDSTRPLFFMMNYFDSHAPYIIPPPFRDKFLNQPRQGFVLDEGVDITRITPEQVEEEIGAYDGTIAYSDNQLGLLLSELDKLGMARNTLVIVTSDHGQAFGEHGTYMHRNDLYREAIHVPLVMWWPGKVPANVRITRPVSNAAIAATIEDLVGGGATQVFPRRSLAQLWKSPESEKDWPWPLVEVSQLPDVTDSPTLELKRAPISSGWMKSLVSPRWHYIVHEKHGAELYDWNSDPQERNNLAKTPEAEEVLREFSAKLKEILAKPHSAAASRPPKKEE